MPAPADYERTPPAPTRPRAGDTHHHLACRHCGTVTELDRTPAPSLAAARTHGFTVDAAEVVYWGRCPACATA